MTISDATLRDIYENATTIAVVGASTDPDKAAHRIPRYLQEEGYRIVPVNPGADEVLGERAHDTVTDIERAVHVVEVFRPSEEAPEIAREATKVGADVLWLQEGIVSEEAREIAEDAGLTVVMDRCMGATHRDLFR